MRVIRLWGITRVEADGLVVDDFPGVKSRQLLEFLSLRHGLPCGKEALADAMWEEAPPPSYATTLEGHVCGVRRVLARGGLDGALRTVSGGYVLDASVQVDLTSVSAALADALHLPPRHAFVHLRDLAVPPVADLLASSPYATYAATARTGLRSLVTTALRHASAGALASGDPEQAVRLGRHALAEDPLCDQSALAVMVALVAADAPCEALRTYADFRDLSRDELGVEPGEALQRLYLSILAGSLRAAAGTARMETSMLRRLLATAQ